MITEELVEGHVDFLAEMIRVLNTKLDQGHAKSIACHQLFLNCLEI